MSPPPITRSPTPMQQHLATLQRNFATFDTAKETVKGKPLFGGGADHIVSKEDLQVVRDHPGRFTPAQVEAARFFLNDPSARGQVDTAADTGADTGQPIIPDNRIGQLDVNAAVRDAADFAEAGTFASQRPAIPADGKTPQQQAALVTLLQNRPTLGGDDGRSGVRDFTRNLKEHQGDAQWQQGYFRALGAGQGGALLHQALAGGGEGREPARQALQALQQQGLLNGTDLASGQFKTTPRSEDSFSLKTLLDADRVQQAVEARRHVIDKTEHRPENTGVYDAYDALLTVTDPQNSAQIQKMADRYGIDPALLAGTVASEMDFDHNRVSSLFDGLRRHGHPFPVDDGRGITSVHGSGLRWATSYLKDHGLQGGPEALAFTAADPDRSNGADMPRAIEGAAIELAALSDVRKSNGASVSRPEDMAVIWAAFRTGVGGIGMPTGLAKGLTGKLGFGMPQPIPEGKGGYPNLQAFLNNQAQGADKVAEQAGDPHLKIGGNAYQSEPYFDALTRLT